MTTNQSVHEAQARWQLCVCYSSNVRTQHHTLGELCSSRLQPRLAALWQGPFGHTAPSGRHIPPTTLCHISFLPASLCCAAVQLGSARQGPAHEAHTNSASAALQGCHGELQQRWREILQQFPLLPQLFFPPQLALLSATEDPALKGTGKGKMFLAR